MRASAAKTVAITGATRGLGYAMARGFAERGHAVAGCGRSRERIEALRGELGSPHLFEVVDVAGDGVDAWAAAVVERLGAPDLLINNAGLINRPAALWEVPAEELSRVVDVNLKGSCRVIRAFLPAMIERGSGVVVNFSSGWGRSTSPEVAPYCATKWAIEGLTRALAQELPAGLAAVAVNPGVIRTDMLVEVWGEAADAYPPPERWAERAVPFLLGLGARHNGRSLDVG